MQMECPECGKWIPDYSDVCYTCGYDFDDESCYCPCSSDDDNDYYSRDNENDYFHKYGSGTKRCVCGKWVPGHSKQCWTCRHWFY